MFVNNGKKLNANVHDTFCKRCVVKLLSTKKGHIDQQNINNLLEKQMLLETS